jgi:hypothetical protein
MIMKLKEEARAHGGCRANKKNSIRIYVNTAYAENSHLHSNNVTWRTVRPGLPNCFAARKKGFRKPDVD